MLNKIVSKPFLTLVVPWWEAGPWNHVTHHRGWHKPCLLCGVCPSPALRGVSLSCCPVVMGVSHNAPTQPLCRIKAFGGALSHTQPQQLSTRRMQQWSGAVEERSPFNFALPCMKTSRRSLRGSLATVLELFFEGLELQPFLLWGVWVCGPNK